MHKAAFKRFKNFVHKTHIVFENLSIINGDMLHKAWGLNIGEGSNFPPLDLPPDLAHSTSESW